MCDVSLQAVVFLEPFSYSFSNPLNYSLPAISFGAQYSEEFPKCIYPGFDYQHFYKMLQCPKILMNATVSYNTQYLVRYLVIILQGFGHCDILNEIDWESKL